MPLPEQSPPAAGIEPTHPGLRPDLPARRGGDQFFYGGQAVIEGVMMRGKRHYAVAVRLPNTKQIAVDKGELKAAIYVNPFWKLPMVRGLALIGEQLHLGMKALMWSANMNAGAGFELIRFMARHRTNSIIKILLLPVLGTQKFTTREPTDDMLEVAIVAFNSAREGEEDTAGAAA